MTNISQEKKDFRTTILCIKRLNTSWNACEIATFLKQSENAPSLSRASLRKNIARALNRCNVEDRNGSGRPITVSTPRFQTQVRKVLRLKKNASTRKATSI